MNDYAPNYELRSTNYAPNYERNYELENYETMKQHTITSIADEQSVNRRTVQKWLKAANSEHGEIGTMAGNTRIFTDYEKAILLSYAGTNRVSAKTMPQTTNYEVRTTPQTTNETTNYEIEIVDALPEPTEVAIVPTQFNLANLRGGNHTTAAPLALANDALTAIQQLRAAMSADIQQQEQQLQQQRLTAQLLDKEATQLQIEVSQYQTMSQLNAKLEQLHREQQQAALEKLNGYSDGG